MAFDLSTAKPVKQGFDLSTARPVDDVPQETMGDSVAQDALDVTAEAAAGANSTLMAVPDAVIDAGNMVYGGIKGLGRLALGGSLSDAVRDTQARPIPNASDLVEMATGYRPGQGGYMEPGLPRDAVRAAGQVFIPGAIGFTPVAGRNLGTLPGAAAEFSGFGSASPANTVRSITSTIDNSPPVTAPGPDPSLPKNFPVNVVNDTPTPIITGKNLPFSNARAARKAARDAAVKRGQGQVAAAGYKLDDAGNVVKDAAQKKAISAGLDKPIVAQVAASSPADKRQIGKMLRVVKLALQNKTYGDFNLPRQVLGDSVYSRYQPVRAANRQAGKAVNEAVARLKNIPIDGRAFNDGPVREFSEALKELGVSATRDGKLEFRGSVFEGTPGARAIITKTWKRMFDTDVSTLQDAHRLKVFIDEMAGEYGKRHGGLSGKADRVVKELRHNTNQFLREYAPEEYAKANDAYSESIEVLNEVDRLIGKNNNPSPSNFARTARKALSNQQNTDQVMLMLEQLDALATKYGSQFDDDIKTQMSVVQSIEKMFPSSKPPASFGGEIDKSLEAARRAGQQSTGTTLVDLGIAGAKKVFGKTPNEQQEELLVALEKLIASGQK